MINRITKILFSLLTSIMIVCMSGCFGIKNKKYNPDKDPDRVPIRAHHVFAGYTASGITEPLSPSILMTGDNTKGQIGLPEKLVLRFMSPLPNPREGISKIILRPTFSLILTDSGQLYAVGENKWGQFGIGKSPKLDRFQPIADYISDVAAGIDFIAILRKDGTLMVSGHNNKGQLGTGDNIDRFLFITAGHNITHISAGDQFLLSINQNGKLMGNGSNESGQLGTNSNTNVFSPIVISQPFVLDAVAGPNFSFVILGNNILCVSGNNTKGQLGLGDTLPRKIFTQVPITLSIKKIALGKQHSLLLTNNGEMLVAGDNHEGQLGFDQPSIQDHFTHSASEVVDIAATANGSIFINANNYIYASGSNKKGELGLGYTVSSHGFSELFSDEDHKEE
ncbi:RCC1 domain-containing protein [Candidatus Ichthyocystis hellenicum]|uniref:RCC1 domain-containing protein n=1 Tax=Candidatus Ichthyocystis hellenicum TaxID=1561003 RepID=UPI000A77DF72|nr:hypothetical protein [Candidatus Ichthyocystis hellenicum]